MKHIATIVVTDDGANQVNVKCTFGEENEPGGADENSAAHRTAVQMLKLAVQQSEEAIHG